MYNVSASCPNGQYCSTSFWGGIGGYPVSFLGSPYSTPLIQSGIWYSNFGQPMGPRLFVEYLSSDNMTGAPVYLQLSNQYFSLNFAVNDEIYVSGWSSPNQNCNGMDSSGGWGCFWFWDVTQGWYTNGPQQQFPGGNPFVGATAEWIAEVANIGYLTSVGTPTSNATYVVQGMDGMGYDPGGNGHTAQAGDPYILVEQAEFLPNAPADHNEFNYVTFSTFGQSYADYQPQAWVYFYFQNNL
jgi:hypothetical protein